MKRFGLRLWGQLATCAAVFVLLAAAPPADAGVVITECGTADPDFAEIQNLSSSAVDTSGWFVVANDANDIGGPSDINSFHATLWNLPASIAPGEVLYRSDIDDGSGNFWGENIFWRTSGPGWAMLVDDGGSVADFVVWNYSQPEIDSLAINVGGFDLTAAGAWSGAAAAVAASSQDSLQRCGFVDHDDASDWFSINPPSMGVQNGCIPEPSTLWLAATAVLALAAYAWRRRR